MNIFVSSTLSFWRAVTAEFLSTFLNLIIICSIHSTVSNDPDLPYSLAQVYCGMVTGLGIIAITAVSLPVSGAHINPAITIASALIRRISPMRAMAYISAQCCGAIAGAGAVIGLNGSSHQLTATKITDLGLELILTFLVVMVALRVSECSQREKGNNSEVIIGLTYAAGLTATRGELNPAGALGLSFMYNKYNNHWVSWVGPIVGGAAAALCHQMVARDTVEILVNNKRLYNAIDNVRQCSQSVIHTNHLQTSTPKCTTEYAEKNSDNQTIHQNHYLFCPVVQPTSAVMSQARRQKHSSLPKGESYQHPCVTVIDGNKDSQSVESGVLEVKVKKRVHYTKDSFDEGFTDAEDRDSRTSSGYYSESVKQMSLK